MDFLRLVFLGGCGSTAANSDTFLIPDSAIVSDQANKIVFTVTENGTVDY